MRKLLALCILLAAGIAAAAAGGILLASTGQVTFTDCSSSGSSASTLTEGTYLMTATDESVWVCSAASSATCASGGSKFGAPFAMLYAVPRGGLSIACRSTSSTGDLQFTPTGN
jgi:hypothetical protein